MLIVCDNIAIIISMMKKFIAYYRIPDLDGVNDDAEYKRQENIIRYFLKDHGQIVDEQIEYEGVKQGEKTDLEVAIEKAKQKKAVILFSEFGVLSRNIDVLISLQKTQTKFTFADLPQANNSSVDLLISLAMYESMHKSQRIREGLAKRKNKGLALGTPRNLTREIRKKGPLVRQRIARESQANVQASILANGLQEQGYSLEKIAKFLNERGYHTRNGKSFRRETVRRLLHRRVF
jgi:DNA invertase Pin-like site-specific DNA recombinase